MEYLNLILKNPIERLGLGDPNRTASTIDEATIIENFNAYSSCITITLKGSHKLRAMENNLEKQYQFFVQNLLPIIKEHATFYYVVPELHKCQQWLHFHGIIHFKKMSHNAKVRKRIYECIDKPLKRGMSYKTRILIEKVYDLNCWIPYLLKEQPLMNKLNPMFQPKYKLVNNNKQDLFTVNL